MRYRHAAKCFFRFPFRLRLWFVRLCRPSISSCPGRVRLRRGVLSSGSRRRFCSDLGGAFACRVWRLRSQAGRRHGLGVGTRAAGIGSGTLPARRTGGRVRFTSGLQGSRRCRRCLGVVAPAFPSRSLARAWAVACGVDPAAVRVSGSPGAWFSVAGPARSVSCLFCLRMGWCGGSPAGGCGFAPGRWWPGLPGKQMVLDW
jgi:hypothetical protein